ncbi:glycosyltransferase family 4 protein [Klebsiella variicola]|uniref:glycosyltransferase n=1 Tax=Klebsiella variicola TaxID=244366 RepID=UPI000D740319|nr:glycosyltransferase [Klebsiella variicola]PXK95013.1 glycosyltransferase family 4 protein [Klebsiella variicola]HBX9988519.1 glycosyltransferase family 4 protein [Klebsiella variicola]
MRKIAFVIENAYSYAGTENVCNYMSECLGDHADITIYSLSGKGETFYPYNKIANLKSYSGRKNKIFNIIKDINEEKPDTVFVISMGKLSVFFIVLATFFLNKNKMKLITCEHVSLDSFPFMVKFLKYTLLRLYHNVVVLTERDSKKLSKYHIKNIKISNPLKYRYYVRKVRTKIALAVGRLEEQKGFDRLLPIWHDFLQLKDTDGWLLYIAGDGSKRAQLESQAKSLNLESKVKFLGKVSDMPSLYKECDILLMTSRYEGLPMVLLEAKSWSMPVIAFDCPTGPREIISNDVDGFLASDSATFLNALRSYTNDETYFRMSRSTEQTAVDFSEEKIAKLWLSLI